MRASLVVAVAALAGWLASSSGAHWAPEIPKHNLRHAIQLHWCGHVKRPCRTAQEAWNVAKCETGGTFSVWAGYGKHSYWGLWQMGTSERERYGHAWNVWGQARAAARYWRAAEWSPWQCLPWGGLRW